MEVKRSILDFFNRSHPTNERRKCLNNKIKKILKASISLSTLQSYTQAKWMAQFLQTFWLWAVFSFPHLHHFIRWLIIFFSLALLYLHHRYYVFPSQSQTCAATAYLFFYMSIIKWYCINWLNIIWSIIMIRSTQK